MKDIINIILNWRDLQTVLGILSTSSVRVCYDLRGLAESGRVFAKNTMSVVPHFFIVAMFQELICSVIPRSKNASLLSHKHIHI